MKFRYFLTNSTAQINPKQMSIEPQCTETRKRGGETPWKFIGSWAEHRERLERIVDGLVLTGAYKHPLPTFLVNQHRQCLLPWRVRAEYPFPVPVVGRSGISLFLKLLLYSMEHGSDRVIWAKNKEVFF